MNNALLQFLMIKTIEIYTLSIFHKITFSVNPGPEEKIIDEN